jgi:pyruvate, water dikinase
MTAFVRDISTLRLSDAEEAGGKGANMGEMVYQDSMRAGE